MQLLHNLCVSGMTVQSCSRLTFKCCSPALDMHICVLGDLLICMLQSMLGAALIMFLRKPSLVLLAGWSTPRDRTTYLGD